MHIVIVLHGRVLYRAYCETCGWYGNVWDDQKTAELEGNTHKEVNP